MYSGSFKIEIDVLMILFLQIHSQVYMRKLPLLRSEGDHSY